MEAPASFESILAKIRAGDERALEYLLATHAVSMRRIAAGYIGSLLRSYVDADDLVQQVALILWNGFRGGKFHAASSQQLMTLIRVLLKRQAAKACRRFTQGMSATESHLSVGLADRCRIPTLDPAKKAEVQEQIEQLMEQAREDDRHMLDLLLLGHSIAAAARILQIEPSTLRKRLSRFRERAATAHVPSRGVRCDEKSEGRGPGRAS